MLKKRIALSSDHLLNHIRHSSAPLERNPCFIGHLLIDLLELPSSIGSFSYSFFFILFAVGTFSFTPNEIFRSAFDIHFLHVSIQPLPPSTKIKRPKTFVHIPSYFDIFTHQTITALLTFITTWWILYLEKFLSTFVFGVLAIGVCLLPASSAYFPHRLLTSRIVCLLPVSSVSDRSTSVLIFFSVSSGCSSVLYSF